MPAPARIAPPTARAAAPVNEADPARTPTTPREYLSSVREALGSKAATSTDCSASTVGVAEVEADVDELDAAGVAGARVDEEPGLERAERHGDIRGHGGAGDLAGATRRRRSARRPPPPPQPLRAASPTSAAASARSAPDAADADDAVDDEVSVGQVTPRRECRRPPGRRRRAAHAVRPRARRSVSSNRAGPGRRGAPGGAGEQRVAAVVAAADEQHDPGAVDAGAAGRARRWPARSRRAASACPPAASPSAARSAARTASTSYARRHSSALSDDDADAMPASWRERHVPAAGRPARRRARRRVPVTAQLRRPGLVGVHLGVEPVQPAGRAERLGQRLLGGEPRGQRRERQAPARPR